MTLCPFVSKFKDTISAVWPNSVCRHSPDSTSKTLVWCRVTIADCRLQITDCRADRCAKGELGNGD